MSETTILEYSTNGMIPETAYAHYVDAFAEVMTDEVYLHFADVLARYHAVVPERVFPRAPTITDCTENLVCEVDGAMPVEYVINTGDGNP